MSVRSLTVRGFRGFSERQCLRLAQPTGEAGSGLTVLVGPNNGGKSTVVELLQVLFGPQEASFSVGKRNTGAEGRVSIGVELDTGEPHELRTVDAGGSETVRHPGGGPLDRGYVLPSRRFFDPYFGRGEVNRENYLRAWAIPATRSTAIGAFHHRLFTALGRKSSFDEVFSRVMDPVPDWTIDQSDQGQFYIRLGSAGGGHTSDGLGEGVISLLFLVDALYDSNPGDLIVVDEPELSLHPAYQRRLAGLFADYAKDRQIVLATHSPYFVDFGNMLDGAEVARVHKRGAASVISQPQRETVEQLGGLLRDSHNPHVLGPEAREAFFQQDGVVLLERPRRHRPLSAGV